MIEIWDYFMRRKGLLLAMLLVFFASSMLSYRALHSNAVEPTTEYISISNWGAERINIPNTGGESDLQPFLAVMNPSQVTELEESIESESDPESDESRPYVIIEQPEDIVNSNSITKPTYHKPRTSLFYTIFLAVMGVLVLILGGYLTYWHFRR